MSDSTKGSKNSKQTQTQLTLRPVCVGYGDAIFITVQDNGSK